MRLGELLPLEWERVNRGMQVFRVDDTKTGAPLELPITRQLASILDRRWTKSGHLKGGWVFPPASSRTGHFVKLTPDVLLASVPNSPVRRCRNDTFIYIFLTDLRNRTMSSLPKRVMEHASGLPEATPICPAALLHLGKRAAVDQALARLARAGRLMRICQGVYMHPVETRFGPCPPRIGKALEALSELWGETIVPCGGSAANRLGLTAQNPVREVYLTSGRSRRLQFGRVTVELRHAPRWQLAAPRRKAGEVIRALAWLGPHEVEEGLEALLPGLSGAEVDELAAARAIMPIWMAEPISARLAHG